MGKHFSDVQFLPVEVNHEDDFRREWIQLMHKEC
jgi:hypothetical protein